MGREIMYKCDFKGCDRVRTETNHWFMVNHTSRSIIIRPFDAIDVARFKLCCSEAHAIQFLNEWLGKFNNQESKVSYDSNLFAADLDGNLHQFRASNDSESEG